MRSIVTRAPAHLAGILAVLGIAATMAGPASVARANAQSALSATAAWQRAPLAFVVIRDDAPGGMRGFVDALERAGGHAAVVYPPTAAVVFADQATLEAPALRRRIAALERGRIASSAALAREARTARAVQVWNASLEMAAAAALEPAAGAAGDATGTTRTDAGPLPLETPWRTLAPRPLVSDHLPYGADYYDTSGYMAGSVAVGLWLLDAPPSSPYRWSTAHETQTIAGVQSGLANWARKGGPATFLTFYLDIHTRVPVSGAPIENAMSMDEQWMNEALGNAGWSGADGFEKCFAYNNAIRDTFDTNWCYSIVIVESDPSVNQGLFSGGGYAWAYYGGPWVYMARYSTWAYGSFSYYAGVPMHETGHIFYDTDEYDGVLQYNGYLNAPDDPNLPNCIMNRNDTTRVCPNTRNQLGWRDLDADGVIDPLDSPPATSLTPFAPDPTPNHSPTWSGTAQVTTIPNLSPFSRYSPAHAITVATIDAVDCRADRGPWSSAVPGDGAFDGYAEAFTWTPPPLSDGGHLVEARAHDSAGNWTVDYASDSVYVTPPAAVGAAVAGNLRLYAPHPNPARGRTELRWQLSGRRRVEVELVDLAGRRIRLLEPGRMFEAGTGGVAWDGRDASGVEVPDGVYLARVRAGTEARVQRIVMAR